MSQGKFKFTQQAGQHLFVCAFFLRGVMRQLLCDQRCPLSLGIHSKIARFMGVNKVGDLTAEMHAQVAAMFEALAHGFYDDVLMEWGGLNQALPSPPQVEPVKGFIKANLSQMLGNHSHRMHARAAPL